MESRRISSSHIVAGNGMRIVLVKEGRIFCYLEDFVVVNTPEMEVEAFGFNVNRASESFQTFVMIMFLRYYQLKTFFINDKSL